ncbi:MAG: MarR family transcriptional regulator [Nanoarchaeota archaeon]|nr:MarR family transcriptional regulator [Nanoarchaeota archaeon]
MRRIISFFIFIILVSSGSAYTYISGEMAVQSSGNTLVDIETNANLTFGESSDLLTSKNGGLWAFHLISSQVFDQIHLEVCLPRNTDNIGRIESNLTYRIDFSGRTCIEFIDFNSSLDISIPYTLKKDKEASGNFILWILVGIVAMALLIFYLLKLKKGKEKFSDIKYLVNDNEMRILDALMKGEMRQKELRKKLDLPKASFSRYLHNLEKKRLIVRKGFGKNKIVSLK